MKKLYKFKWDCRRMGVLDGIFIADDTDVEAVIGKEVDFGEVLGKHSEIYGTLEAGDIEVLSADYEFIEAFIGVMGDGTISGFNPLEYYDDAEQEELLVMKANKEQ